MRPTSNWRRGARTTDAHVFPGTRLAAKGARVQGWDVEPIAAQDSRLHSLLAGDVASIFITRLSATAVPYSSALICAWQTPISGERAACASHICRGLGSRALISRPSPGPIGCSGVDKLIDSEYRHVGRPANEISDRSGLIQTPESILRRDSE
ncbi:unnamed protein product, partial [Iphiclides podalirius]